MGGGAYYTAGNGVCKKVPEGCNVVNTNGTCRSCLDGFEIVLGRCQRCLDKSCIACTSSYCEKCGANGFCSKCGGPFVGMSTSCQPCKDPLCGECRASSSQCTSCATGSMDGGYPSAYMDPPSGRCRLCPANCGLCTLTRSGVRCEACNQGYAAVDGACKRCPKLCSYCSISPSKCDANGCYDPSPAGLPLYQDSQGQCQEGRIKGCEQYGPDGTCSSCAYGYLLRGGKCVL